MKNSALLVIDVQQGFDDPYWGKRNNLNAEANITLLLDIWRKNDLPVIHVHHCSVNLDSLLRPDHSGNQHKSEAQPLHGEKQFHQTSAENI